MSTKGAVSARQLGQTCLMTSPTLHPRHASAFSRDLRARRSTQTCRGVRAAERPHLVLLLDVAPVAAQQLAAPPAVAAEVCSADLRARAVPTVVQVKVDPAVVKGVEQLVRERVLHVRCRLDSVLADPYLRRLVCALRGVRPASGQRRPRRRRPCTARIGTPPSHTDSRPCAAHQAEIARLGLRTSRPPTSAILVDRCFSTRLSHSRCSRSGWLIAIGRCRRCFPTC